ncbi:hypothetical protein AK812_SmicGene33237 [Symbiodinium microadriaticum]|uniref:Reverse transcriptase domain-containing protein n=1 Tax=Symbiodinium microadriaticum TaxID=2951 RepID=A0A1Q9CS32_SYMMI|nr:hypothetical protein AK812_SmicGene33237 [Symbiodinium microadriaticum]
MEPWDRLGAQVTCTDQAKIIPVLEESLKELDRQQGHHAEAGGSIRIVSLDWGQDGFAASEFHNEEEKQANTNWAAKLLDNPNWKAMVALISEVALRCKHVPWRPFTESEMRITMAKWQNRKATGPDGIALEALRFMFEDDEWRPKIAEMLNDSLYRGALPRWATEGSPDSPVLFAAAIGEALDATLAAVNGGAAFMDDTYVWGESPEYVQQVLAELEVRLSAIGLKINAKKTQVISNLENDPRRFTIGGVTVKPDGPKDVMTILGAPISMAGDISPLVAEMQGRARRSFHKHKKVLCSSAPLKDNDCRKTPPSGTVVRLEYPHNEEPSFQLHKDVQNTWLPNLVVELRPSEGGGTWVEDSQGDFAVEGELQNQAPLQPPGTFPPNDLGGMDPSRMDIRTDTELPIVVELATGDTQRKYGDQPRSAQERATAIKQYHTAQEELEYTIQQTKPNQIAFKYMIRDYLHNLPTKTPKATSGVWRDTWTTRSLGLGNRNKKACDVSYIKLISPNLLNNHQFVNHQRRSNRIDHRHHKTGDSRCLSNHHRSLRTRRRCRPHNFQVYHNTTQRYGEELPQTNNRWTRGAPWLEPLQMEDHFYHQNNGRTTPCPRDLTKP